MNHTEFSKQDIDEIYTLFNPAKNSLSATEKIQEICGYLGFKPSEQTELASSSLISIDKLEDLQKLDKLFQTKKVDINDLNDDLKLWNHMLGAMNRTLEGQKNIAVRQEVGILIDHYQKWQLYPGSQEFDDILLAFIGAIRQSGLQTFFNALDANSKQYVFEMLGYAHLKEKNLETFKAIATPIEISVKQLNALIAKLPPLLAQSLSILKPNEQIKKVLEYMGLDCGRVHYSNKLSCVGVQSQDANKIQQVLAKGFSQDISKQLEQKENFVREINILKNISLAMKQARDSLTSVFYSKDKHEKFEALKQFKENFDQCKHDPQQKEKLKIYLKKSMTDASFARDGSGNVDTHSSSVFFDNLNQDAKNFIFTEFSAQGGHTYEDYKRLQESFHHNPSTEYKKKLQAQQGNINENIFQAMEKSIEHIPDDKYTSLKKYQQCFKIACEKKDDNTMKLNLEEFLKLAAQPRDGFFKAEFAQTNTCKLFFKNLSASAKAYLFELLDYKPHMNQDFDTFSKLLAEKFPENLKLGLKN